jgi:hypothetical protein
MNYKSDHLETLIRSSSPDLFDQIRNIIDDDQTDLWFKKIMCKHGVRGAINFDQKEILEYLVGFYNDNAFEDKNNIFVDDYDFFKDSFQNIVKKGNLSLIVLMLKYGFDPHRNRDYLLSESIKCKHYHVASYALSIGVIPDGNNNVSDYFFLKGHMEFVPNLIPYLQKTDLFAICAGYMMHIRDVFTANLDLKAVSILKQIILYRIDDLNKHELSMLITMMVATLMTKSAPLKLWSKAESSFCLQDSEGLKSSLEKKLVETLFDFFDLPTKLELVKPFENEDIFETTIENLKATQFNQVTFSAQQLDQTMLILQTSANIFLNNYQKQTNTKRICWKRSRQSLDPIYRPLSMHSQLCFI